MDRYTVRAKNTSTLSENKIHDDATARRFGFAGGLVPGVDVYAYLCHLPAERWGEPWVAAGTMSARLLSPVYDGDLVTVDGALGADGTSMTLRVLDSSGTLCAEATATLEAPAASTAGVDAATVPVAPLPAARPPAERATFDALGDAPLGTIEVGYHADRAGDYLDDVGEDLPLFRDGIAAHPAWLLRQANFVLSANVRLGPWIHVASAATHLAAVRDGDRVTTRARVAALSERKGHKLVDLDVLQVAEPDRPVARIRHTAIYEPRQVASAAS